MNKNSLKALRPMIILFVLLSAFFIIGKSFLAKWGADQDVLLFGNLLLFIVTLTSFLVTYKGLNSSNPQAFVRSMYGSFMINIPH